MMKKVAGWISVLQLIMAVLMYFVVAYHFETDKVIMNILPHTDFEATLLRLSIYIIPGINLICGFFGIVFSTKGLLSFMGILEILAGVLTLHFKGRSDQMYGLGIAMIVMGVLYIICILSAKDKKSKGKRNKEKRVG